MAGAVNLSLLSRGVGEVKRNGHEKVDVVLEPEVSWSIFCNANGQRNRITFSTFLWSRNKNLLCRHKEKDSVSCFRTIIITWSQKKLKMVNFMTQTVAGFTCLPYHLAIRTRRTRIQHPGHTPPAETRMRSTCRRRSPREKVHSHVSTCLWQQQGNENENTQPQKSTRWKRWQGPQVSQQSYAPRQKLHWAQTRNKTASFVLFDRRCAAALQWRLRGSLAPEVNPASVGCPGTGSQFQDVRRPRQKYTVLRKCKCHIRPFERAAKAEMQEIGKKSMQTRRPASMHKGMSQTVMGKVYGSIPYHSCGKLWGFWSFCDTNKFDQHLICKMCQHCDCLTDHTNSVNMPPGTLSLGESRRTCKSSDKIHLMDIDKLWSWQLTS